MATCRSCTKRTVFHLIIHFSKKQQQFEFDAKSIFYVPTGKLRIHLTKIDDSRKFKQPVEILIGKKFKLEVWESIIQTMAVSEVAEFRVDKSLCVSYPVVAKTLRDAFAVDTPKRDDHSQTSSHCCGAMSMAQGPKFGYDDLNHLAEHPSNLLFRIELLSVEPPRSYKKELWQMDENEKLAALPKLKDEGNQLYKEKKIAEAAHNYAQALGILEQLQLKEKPGDEEWTDLADRKIPFLLNYSQCQLLLGNHYDAIEQCSQVLLRDPRNVKALYRRGIAHIKVWNPEEAKKDLQRAAELDATLVKAVGAELLKLEEMEKEKDKSDGTWLRQAFAPA
uniref:EOG090X09NR n=1 Tax=Evadne anonyx TaxID=141404 RepID=A0A9N6ZFE8_9CRUS|nr:EOG090X09NR [Evadne anonyx]